ncbi:MAG: LptF/LptG family permease [Lentisphaeria bacterium]
MTKREKETKNNPKKVRRKLSAILFWYFTRRFLLPLFCCLAAFCVLFLISDVLNDLEDFIEAGAPAGRIILYFLMRQPVNIVNILPMSILLAAVYMLSMLGRHGEITAVRAAGLSITTCAMPVWCFAVLAAGLQFWLNENIGPAFEARSVMLQERLSESSGAVPQEKHILLAFRNPATHRDWFFESFSRDRPKHGVLIKQFRQKGNGLRWELKAASAEVKHGQWVFYNGTRWHYVKGDRLPVPGKTEQFDELRLSLEETPGKIFTSLRPVEELSSLEMYRIVQNRPKMPTSTRNVFWTSIWYRLMWPLSCIVAALFGVGMTIGNERSGAMIGVASALGLMVAYYLVTQIFLMLGRGGLAPPFLAAALPPTIFITWGAWQVYRKR